MEKLMYLTWLDQASSRSQVAEVMLGRVGQELLALDPVRLTVDVWDPESDIPAPVPTPEGETPLHGLVSLWVDTIEQRGAFEGVLHAAARHVAGYSVVESLYRDYGGNQWSAPRSWPDGQRSPGVLTVALLQQHPEQNFDEWITRSAHPDLSDHRGDPAPHPLRPQRRVPADHRRCAGPGGDRRGSLALAGSRDRSDAVLLCGRRPGPHAGARHPDDRGDQRVRRPEHLAQCHDE